MTRMEVADKISIMRCFSRESFSIALLLLSSCAFSQAQSKIDTGYWWNELPADGKLGVLHGYMLAMSKVADVTFFECLADKNGGKIPEKMPSDEIQRPCLENFSVSRWSYGLTVSQLQQGLDAFYRDPRNKAVHLDAAICYVRDQYKGKPAAELAKELESFRANGRQ